MVPANQPQRYQWPKGYVGKSWVSRQETLLFPVDSHIMKDNYVPAQETGEQELHFFICPDPAPSKSPIWDKLGHPFHGIAHAGKCGSGGL